MRLISLIAAMSAALFVLTGFASSANAGALELFFPRTPADRTIYKGFSRDVRRLRPPANSRLDPHQYRYEPRGYYPNYNSGYWRPRRHVYRPRYRFHKPRYYGAWGRHKRRYHHRSWHDRNHGRHRAWHW